MSSPEHVELGQRLTAEVLAPMKAAFVGKDEIIDLLGISLVAGEHLFLLGPPGTAKTLWSRTWPGGFMGGCSIIC